MVDVSQVISEMKTNYFYIDEAGAINNDSKIFIHGCIKTDSPHTITRALAQLKSDWIQNIYYVDFLNRIKSEGIHAAENNMDMQADVYKILPLLDYRSYFVVLNKNTNYFEELLKSHSEFEIFEKTLKKLLHDRIIENRGGKNIFIFEEIQIAKKPLSTIVKELLSEYSSDCDFEIVKKGNENMGVIDYLNYVFYHILTKTEPRPRMIQNFNLVAPKIGLINILHNDVYLSRKKSKKYKVEFENLLREIGGSLE